ncbi:MAG: TldD/PmbA family protein [Candidatus Aminicenantes bacterium]|nr:TldD/PmbA family protein [Candidatus Aminicenantes bacterium]
MKDVGSRAELRRLAERLIKLGKACGADEVEVHVGRGTEFHVDVRLGAVENLVEAGSRSVGFRVIKDRRTASAGSSDLSWPVLERLMKNAVARALLASSDDCAGLPPHSRFKVEASTLGLYDPEVPLLSSRAKIDLALETERIALSDKRITNSHGASFSAHHGGIILANSNGFRGEYEQTYCSLGIGLQAGATDDLAEDGWSSNRRRFRDLESPEAIARKAVERTVRQLNPRKIRTQNVPVVFEQDMTAWLLGFLFGCVSGTAVYQKATFLAGKLGLKIAAEGITVLDDGLMPGMPGTRPFDAEGVPCRKTAVVEAGILKNFLTNTYAARKLGTDSTGNGDGSGVGPNNFYLVPGRSTPEDIVGSVEKGLLLVRTLGHGLNPVTGDISRGAFGLWIEGGAVAYPVSEVTIAGNLGDILNGIEMIGNDLDFRSAIAGPTLKVAEMTVAGI